jgi:hypothetical protein
VQHPTAAGSPAHRLIHPTIARLGDERGRLVAAFPPFGEGLAGGGSGGGGALGGVAMHATGAWPPTALGQTSSSLLPPLSSTAALSSDSMCLATMEAPWTSHPPAVTSASSSGSPKTFVGAAENRGAASQGGVAGLVVGGNQSNGRKQAV